MLINIFYRTSENASRDHEVNSEPVSFAKPIVLGTTRKKTLC